MSGFVRKFGKAKTFSNLVVQLVKIFFAIVTSANPISKQADRLTQQTSPDFLCIVCTHACIEQSNQCSGEQYPCTSEIANQKSKIVRYAITINYNYNHSRLSCV